MAFERLTKEDAEVLKASMSDVNIFTKYYFDIELLPHQVLTAHAQQKSILTLGGRGSGKTFGWLWTYIWLCTLLPDFRLLWGSYSADQAAIPFNDIAVPNLLSSERFAKFLPEGPKSLKRKPYPQIDIQIPGSNAPRSTIVFKTVGMEAKTKRGFTLDAIHYDEGGLEYDPRVISTLRPSMRGRRFDGSPRLGRFSVSTTPTDSPWLRDWWQRANDPAYIDYDPKSYFGVRVASAANTSLTPEQLESFYQDMTPEERQVEIQAEFPEYTGSDFSPRIVEMCQDKDLNQEVTQMIAAGRGEANLMIVGKAGCIHYQKPMVEGHKYILSGDPGTGNPPYRNSGVIVCFDVTHPPYELVLFRWVSGNGDYAPFFTQYEEAYMYYKPISAVFDATGTQKAMNELFFEARNLVVEGMSMTSIKPAMINALKIFMQRGMIRFPFIQGLRLQLLSYRQEKDKNMAQDIVMAVAMAAHKMRMWGYDRAEEEVEPDEYVVFDAGDGRNERDSSRSYRGT